jgi:hypothetical protein
LIQISVDGGLQGRQPVWSAPLKKVTIKPWKPKDMRIGAWGFTSVW